MHLLTGDIGGTRTRFRLLEKHGGSWQVRHQESYPSRDFPSLTEAVDRYLHCQLPGKLRKEVHAAWFAVAGPVQGESVAFTNLSWRINANDLAKELGLASVHLINDLEALAYATPFLPESELIPVQQGMPGNDRFLVIAAGTGLGMASLWANDKTIEAFSSEGGHCDLAPVKDIHVDLHGYLQNSLEHVSYERVLSGTGLVTLYDFVHLRRMSKSPPDKSQASLSPASVSELARHGDPVAGKAVEYFVQLLAGFAGNAALQWLALGGVYLAGGVSVGLQSFLAGDTFINAFHHKGRMRPIMEQIPVSIITDGGAGLEGITRFAIRHQDY